MERPCQCQNCNLCAMWNASRGLPVKMPVVPKPIVVPVKQKEPDLFSGMEET